MSEDLILPSQTVTERYRGLNDKEFGDALAVLFIALETMNKRQRWEYRHHAKEYCKHIAVRWPNGRPYKDIADEIGAAIAKTAIIKPGDMKA